MTHSYTVESPKTLTPDPNATPLVHELTSMPPQTPTNIQNFSPQTTCAKHMYSDRAQTYDASAGGWHVELGQDFAIWTAPAPGSAVLDLACGTGLVTLPMAAAVGRSGVVVGVDVTAAMLHLARRKGIPEGSARVEWVEADISEGLGGVEVVRRVVEERGGFDVISCCSALVLLGDPVSVVRRWVDLLRRGGRLIVDVPSEEHTLQYLFTVALRAKLGMSLPFDREWVRGIESLEGVYKEVGLEVEKSWRTKSYVPERWYEDDECTRDEVFDRQTRELYLGFAKEGRVEDAKAAWKDVWKLGVEDGKGKVYEGQPLYVSIGRKPGCL